MANPYSFSSGYLAARELKEKERAQQEADSFRREVLGPYYDSIKKENENKAGLYGIQAKGAQLDMDIKQHGFDRKKRRQAITDPFVEKSLTDMMGTPKPTGQTGGQGLKVPSSSSMSMSNPQSLALDDSNDFEDLSSLNAGWTMGVQMAPNYSIASADGTPGGVRMYADASIGGVQPVAAGLRGPGEEDPMQVAQAATPAPAPSPSPAERAPQKSNLDLLADQEPGKAKSIARNIFNAPEKQFQNMMKAFSIMDWADEKIDSGELMKRSQSIKKMQSENLGEALQFALAGNYEKAKSVFAQTGDDRGENIEAMKKIRIDNPVPGAAKGTKNSYDGLEVTYKDGTKAILDPRRLLAETVSLKEVIDNEYRFGDSIRRTDASVYATDTNAEANRLKREELNQNKQQQYALSFNQQLSGDMKAEIDREAKARGVDDLLNAPEGKAIRDGIEQKYRSAQTIGTMNIMGGVMISPQQAMDIANGLTPDFYRDPANFKTDPKTGKVMSGNVNGQVMLQTAAGVLVPAPIIRKKQEPQQSGTPDMPTSQPEQQSAAPAAQARPQSLEEFRAQQQQQAERQRIEAEQAEAQRQQRIANIEKQRQTAQAKYPLSVIKTLNADEANFIRDSEDFHLLTGEQQRAITRAVSFGAPSRKKTYGLTRN